MELLDRYLESVRKHLPWQRQDDIVAELRANLESQLDEKEEALGRPLTQAEAEAWIKQLGAPIQVAAGYQPQQYLIGPHVFPTYRYVLKLACSWAMIIYSIVAVVQVFATQNPSGTTLLDALLHLPFVLMTTAAWVTLIFAAIEYAVAQGHLRLPALCAPSPGWTPGSLPPLGQDAVTGKKPRSFAQAVAEVVFGILFLGWLLLVPKHPRRTLPEWVSLSTGGHLGSDLLVPCRVEYSATGMERAEPGPRKMAEAAPGFQSCFQSRGIGSCHSADQHTGPCNCFAQASGN